MDLTERKALDKLAFGTCLAGVVGAAAIALLGRMLNEDLSMIAYGTFVGLEVIALVLGIVSRARPLGKASAIAAGILLVGSIAFVS
jgi:hypothetical protein